MTKYNTLNSKLPNSQFNKPGGVIVTELFLAVFYRI